MFWLTMFREAAEADQSIIFTFAPEAGMAPADVCRRHGISSATFCKWKSKHGGLEVSEARRLRRLEEENARLKKPLAEAMLDNVVLKDLASRNGDAHRSTEMPRIGVCFFGVNEMLYKLS